MACYKTWSDLLDKALRMICVVFFFEFIYFLFNYLFFIINISFICFSLSRFYNDLALTSSGITPKLFRFQVLHAIAMSVKLVNTWLRIDILQELIRQRFQLPIYPHTFGCFCNFSSDWLDSRR